MPVWSQLCPELKDLIVDFSADDPPSLVACSLACKALIPRTRFHLFHSVKLSPVNVTAFLKIFRSSTTATIIPFIKHMSYGYVNLPTRDYRFYVPAHGVHPALRVRSTFVEVLLRLPTLPAVTDLTLMGVVMGSGLPQITEIFPNLSSLRFSNVDFRLGVTMNISPVVSTDITSSSLLPSARDLRSLRISSFRWLELCDTYSWVSGLLPQPFGLKLTSISLFCMGCRDYAFLLRFLRLFGDELVDLALMEESYMHTMVDFGKSSILKSTCRS